MTNDARRRLSWVVLLFMVTLEVLGMSVTRSSVALADAAPVSVEVTVTDPCAVELVGVSEMAEGYRQSAEVTGGHHSFPVSVEEPGEYHYELRQVASGDFLVYDETVYDVYVSAYYEQGSIWGIVTGGIKGSEEKLSSFVFSKPTPPDPDPGTNLLTITYDLNGGTYDGSPDDIIERYPYGTEISVHEAPSREGHSFLFWRGSEHRPGDMYVVVDDHTFVAQWEPSHTGGGQGFPSDPTPDGSGKASEEPIPVSVPAPVRNALLQMGVPEGMVPWVALGILGVAGLLIVLVVRRMTRARHNQERR